MKLYSLLLFFIAALVLHAQKPNFVIIFNDDMGYACGGNANVALLVNGEKQTDLLLPTTGGWSTYKAAKVYLNLKSGKNQFLFRSQKKGGVNLDYFDLNLSK